MRKFKRKAQGQQEPNPRQAEGTKLAWSRGERRCGVREASRAET